MPIDPKTMTAANCRERHQTFRKIYESFKKDTQRRANLIGDACTANGHFHDWIAPGI